MRVDHMIAYLHDSAYRGKGLKGDEAFCPTVGLSAREG